MMKQDERKALIGKYTLLILGTVLILVPLLATLFSSFKPTKDIVDNFFGFPTNFTWDNFSRLLADGIGGYYWNSVVITVLSLLAVMIFIPMAAYSIARNMSKRKAFTIMYTLLILGIFVPFQVIMIPITVMMSKLGLANIFGLILLYLTYAIPQTLFLYVGYIKISIPESLDEAAEIDGANQFTTYFRIIFPMMKPIDAFAYAVKKLDTNDFFVEPDIWDLLDKVRDIADEYGTELLPEIHEHYSIQFKIADHDYYVYDFALPMVTLYTLYSSRTERLAKWLKMSPMKQFTTLDTHDGIGVVDVKDILTDEEIDYASNELYKVGANVKRKYSSAEYNNLDIYQINSTYYSALGDDDVKYFLARLIQAFAPGIPQVYYVGLLAGKNDLKLLEETKEGRNINRHYYSNEEIAKEVQRPVVKALLNLFSFRNRSEAFDLEGTTEIETPTAHSIVIKRQNKDKSVTAVAEIDLQNQTYRVIENGVEVTF
ncbi:TPA: sucrose phosphorylase [Streptococcus pneumoniae]|nr:sucrose phosphorylase [Streptococcus pneumoniae]